MRDMFNLFRSSSTSMGIYLLFKNDLLYERIFSYSNKGFLLFHYLDKIVKNLFNSFSLILY